MLLLLLSCHLFALRFGSVAEAWRKRGGGDVEAPKHPDEFVFLKTSLREQMQVQSAVSSSSPAFLVSSSQS